MTRAWSPTPWLLLAPALALLTTLLIAPMAIMAAYTSFQYVDIGVEQGRSGPSELVGLRLQIRTMGAPIWKTTRVALITTVICIVIGISLPTCSRPRASSIGGC